MKKLNIEDLPKLSSNNIDELEKYEMCGCYFCIRTFYVDEIIDFIDNGKTALCPNCGMDTILPGVTNGFFLEKANIHWFTGE